VVHIEEFGLEDLRDEDVRYKSWKFSTVFLKEHFSCNIVRTMLSRVRKSSWNNELRRTTANTAHNGDAIGNRDCRVSGTANQATV